MKISYSLAYIEAVKAMWAYLKRMYALWGWVHFIVPLFLVFSVCQVPRNPSFLMSLCLAFSAVGSLALIAIDLVMPAYLYKKDRGEISIALDDKGIRIKNANRNDHVVWEWFHEIWESREFIFLVELPMAYTAVPKRSLGSYDFMAELPERFKEPKKQG